MIFGIGIDLVEVPRIRKALQTSGFAARVFTAAERAYCDGKNTGKAASYAARFAGKEAFVKALGLGLRAGRLTDISIENNEAGQPFIVLSGHYLTIINEKNINGIHISLSHTKEWAMAEVVLEAQA